MTGKKTTTFICVVAIILIIAGISWYIYNDIEEQYLQDDPMLFKMKETLSPLFELYPDLKNTKLYKGEKSYTINKEKIYICLKDEHGEYYPKNHLIYVLLHEYAHALNKDDIGHTPKFDQKFKELLEKASSLGLYDPNIEPIQDYCNHGLPVD